MGVQANESHVSLFLFSPRNMNLCIRIFEMLFVMIVDEDYLPTVWKLEPVVFAVLKIKNASEIPFIFYQQ